MTPPSLASKQLTASVIGSLQLGLWNEVTRGRACFITCLLTWVVKRDYLLVPGGCAYCLVKGSGLSTWLIAFIASLAHLSCDYWGKFRILESGLRLILASSTLSLLRHIPSLPPVEYTSILYQGRTIWYLSKSANSKEENLGVPYHMIFQMKNTAKMVNSGTYRNV